MRNSSPGVEVQNAIKDVRRAVTRALKLLPMENVLGVLSNALNVKRRVLEDLIVMDGDGAVTSAAPLPVETRPAAIDIAPQYRSRVQAYVAGRRHFALIGPPGTFKSSEVVRAARENRLEVVTIQCHGQLAKEDLFGTIGLSNGNTHFVAGPVVTLMKRGGVLLLDEANAAPPSLLIALNRAMDRGPYTIGETGETILPSPNFVVAMTYNGGGLAGTRSMNEALRDRCIVVECGYLNESHEKAVIRHHVPQAGEADLARAVAVATAVRAARRENRTEFDLSIRTLIDWVFDKVNRTGDLLRSFEDVVLPKIGDQLTFGTQREVLCKAVRSILEEGR